MSDRPAAGLEFCKMEGAGNDFIVVAGASVAALGDPGAAAARLCARRSSVGADGLVLIEPSERPGADLRVRFWNPDGSEAAACGNGTRCAARFAAAEGLAPSEMVMETKGGDIAARVDGASVTLRYSVEPELALDYEVTVPDGARRGHRVAVGNHHLVIPVDALPEGAIESMCRPIRYAPELAPEGANVHLAEVVDRHRIRLRSYERGVEAETLACGSGSMSSAVALCAAGRVEPPVAVETRSGDVLTIRFQRRDDARFTGLELEGPARFVYRGRLLESDLHPPEQR